MATLILEYERHVDVVEADGSKVNQIKLVWQGNANGLVRVRNWKLTFGQKTVASIEQAEKLSEASPMLAFWHALRDQRDGLRSVTLNGMTLWSYAAELEAAARAERARAKAEEAAAKKAEAERKAAEKVAAAAAKKAEKKADKAG